MDSNSMAETQKSLSQSTAVSGTAGVVPQPVPVTKAPGMGAAILDAEASQSSIPGLLPDLTTAAVAPVLPGTLAVDFIDRLVSAGLTGVRIVKACLVTQGLADISVEGLMGLDVVRFQGQPGVGKTKALALAQLQTALRQAGVTATVTDVLSSPSGSSQSPVAPLTVDQQAVPVPQLTWTPNELRSLRIGMTRHFGTRSDVTVGDVLGSRHPRWFVGRMKELYPQWRERQDRLAEARAAQERSRLVVLDALLEREVAGFLGNACDAAGRELLEQRWGYDSAKLTLEEIGEVRRVTRQAVEDAQKNAEERFSMHSVISKALLWECLETECAAALPLLMPALGRHFPDAAALQRFLESFCVASFNDEDLREVWRQRLVDLFCVMNPVGKDTLISLLHGRSGSAIQAEKDLRKLQNLGLTALTPDGNGLVPLSLAQSDAAAHVLAGTKGALHWTEMADRVNSTAGLSASPIPVQREGNWVRSAYLAVWGNGCYRHTQCLSAVVTEAAQFAILPRVRALAVQRAVAIPLDEVLNMLRAEPGLQEFGWLIAGDTDAYWTLRHLISKEGHRYGVFFDGLSSRDLVTTVHEGAAVEEHRGAHRRDGCARRRLATAVATMKAA